MDTTIKPNPDAALLTDKQLGAMLGISPRQCWKLAARGVIPKPVHVGSSARWRRSEIDAYISGLSAKN